MITSENAKYRVTAKEGVTGRPVLVFECIDQKGGLSCLNDGFLTLRFREGTTLEQAKAIERTLLDHMEGLEKTGFW